MCWIDAPVSDGPGGAARGELAIMAGGEIGDFETIRPALETYSRQATLMGPVGAGQSTKVCNQLIIGAEICAIAEALNFAARFGMNAADLADALQGGWADSRSCRSWPPDGRRPDPADASMMMKDMDIACDMVGRRRAQCRCRNCSIAYRRAISGGGIAPMRQFENANDYFVQSLPPSSGPAARHGQETDPKVRARHLSF